MVDSIRSLEETVKSDTKEICHALQGRNLDRIEQNCEGIAGSTRGLLTLSEQQLQVSTEHLDVAKNTPGSGRGIPSAGAGPVARSGEGVPLIISPYQGRSR